MGTVWCHIDISKWSKTIYQDMLVHLLSLKEQLKKRGYAYLYAVVPEDKLGLASMFGFKVTHTLDSKYYDRSLYYILRQET